MLDASLDRRYTQARGFSLFSTLIVGALVLLVGGVSAYVFFGNGNGVEETATIAPKPFVQEIAVSGKVQAVENVAMTFERTGRVSGVNVSVGDVVEAGAPLISLDTTTVRAQLAAAESEVLKRQVERTNQGVTLEEVMREQDTKVQAAYRTLLSEGLVVFPQYSDQDGETPTMSGLYTGDEEGVYRMRIERSTKNSNKYVMDISGLERAEIDISSTGPTPLGTRGLYISFPGELKSYINTVWYVNIPNTKSSVYGENYNAYQEALRERARAIEDAQAQIVKRDQVGSIADATLVAARAEVERLRAELAQHTLRAPFDGAVTSVDVEVGDTATPDVQAVTVMSTQKLEVESFVPEINIAYVSVGDPARITLDAYGDYVVFPARVVAIDPAETIRDGVSTYRVLLQFDSLDERVKSGMSANIIITTDARDGVRSVPVGMVSYEGSQAFVTIQTPAGAYERRPVRVGLVSSLGEIEILEGVADGEVVVIPKQ